MNTDECQTHWNNQSASARQNSLGTFLEHVDVEHRNIDRCHRPGAGADGPKASNYGGFILPISGGIGDWILCSGYTGIFSNLSQWFCALSSNVSLESQASPTCDGLANINDWWPLCVFQTCGEAYETKINKAYFDLVGGFNSPEKQARRLESSHSTSRYDLCKMGFTPYGLIPTSRTAGPQDLFDPVAAKVMAHLRYCRKNMFFAG